jgi:hypothetical protein
MLRITLLSFLWIYGLLPTAISLLMVIAMAGKPQKCERPGCVARTYGWELLALPAATASPFVSGFFIARMSSNKKEQHFKSQGGANEA